MTEHLFYCSFCGIDHKRTKVLISGPRVFICDECVALCVEVVAERTSGQVPFPSNGDLVSARAESAKMRRALADVGHVIADALGRVAVKCMWCEAKLADESDARAHVATCDKHPAVIELRALQAAKPKRRRT